MAESGHDPSETRQPETNVFYLEIVLPDGKTMRRVPLPVQDTIVGRSSKRDQVVIEDGKVSRVHLRVHRDPDHGITITDLHSANGTIFDGRRLEPGAPINWLIDQMVIIGDTRIILRYGDVTKAT